MPSRKMGIGHMPDAIFIGNSAAIIGVSGQRTAAMLYKSQRPLPLFSRQIAVGKSSADFLKQLLLRKAAAQGNGNKMLHQNIQWLAR